MSVRQTTQKIMQEQKMSQTIDLEGLLEGQTEGRVTCVRGVYLFFCACLHTIAQKNTNTALFFTQIYKKSTCQDRWHSFFDLTFCSKVDYGRTRVTAYLDVFFLVGIRVHKDSQACEVVHISKYRTWKHHNTRCYNHTKTYSTFSTETTEFI